MVPYQKAKTEQCAREVYERASTRLKRLLEHHGYVVRDGVVQNFGYSARGNVERERVPKGKHLVVGFLACYNEKTKKLERYAAKRLLNVERSGGVLKVTHYRPGGDDAKSLATKRMEFEKKTFIIPDKQNADGSYGVDAEGEGFTPDNPYSLEVLEIDDEHDE